MWRFLQRFNPWLHVAAAVGWCIAILSLVSAIGAGLLVMQQARSALERERGVLFATESSRIVDTINSYLAGRFHLMRAAAELAESSDGSQASEARLAGNVADILAEFDWIGLVKPDGSVIALKGSPELGAHVVAEPWYKEALKQPFIGELGGIVEKFQSSPDGHSVVMAAEVKEGTVLAAHLGWDWLDNAQKRAAKQVAAGQPVEIAVAASDGTVLAGNWQPSEIGLSDDIANFQKYLRKQGEGGSSGNVVRDDNLVGFSRLAGTFKPARLDWWVAMRQPEASAFAPALRSSSVIFAIVAGCGFLTALVAAWLTSLLLRRLNRMAESADGMRLKCSGRFIETAGRDEIARIGKSLAALFDGLRKSNDELVTLNRDLDKRVEQRTCEVARLFEENKAAAITRERLRISRELHDTLAHSLLALLSQVRMIRKIEKRRPELLSAELAEAERVAQEGLNQARAAVGRLRYMAVKDDGLGPALERLIRQLEERVVIDSKLIVDPGVASMASPQAETIYRIAEEALHNVEKHADARHVEVEAGLVDGSGLRLRVEDDGQGFDPGLRKPGHFGLPGLHEQAHLLGAKLVIESEPGRGTRILLDAPLS